VKGTVLIFTAWHDNTENNPTIPIRASGSDGAIALSTKWRTRGRSHLPAGGLIVSGPRASQK
jgi:hypothetical protein